MAQQIQIIRSHDATDFSERINRELSNGWKINSKTKIFVYTKSEDGAVDGVTYIQALVFDDQD